MAAPDWKRAGRALRKRRLQLGIRRQQDAAALAGIGIETWRQLERGAPTRDSSRAAAELTVKWYVGALEDIAQGADPPADQPPAEQVQDENTYTDPAEREIWALTELSEEERRAYIDMLRARRAASRRQTG